MIGVVLAGGLGRRMGAPKAGAMLAGRPLIAYPLEALGSVCERVAVVAKRGSALPPDLAGSRDDPVTSRVERWDEPDEPQHPRAGLAYALERAGGPVLVCAVDMPFVTAETLRLLAAELQPGLMAAVAFAEGRLQPLLAAYAPSALEALSAAPPDEPLRRTAESLMPVLLDIPADEAFNVNTADDLAEAKRRMYG